MTVGSVMPLNTDQKSTGIAPSKRRVIKRKLDDDTPSNGSNKRKLDDADKKQSQDAQKGTENRRRRKIHYPRDEKSKKGTDAKTVVKKAKTATVSTAPSASSSKEIGLPLSEGDININMVIWAHIVGYPWWPSKVFLHFYF